MLIYYSVQKYSLMKTLFCVLHITMSLCIYEGTVQAKQFHIMYYTLYALSWCDMELPYCTGYQLVSCDINNLFSRSIATFLWLTLNSCLRELRGNPGDYKVSNRCQSRITQSAATYPFSQRLFYPFFNTKSFSTFNASSRPFKTRCPFCTISYTIPHVYKHLSLCTGSNFNISKNASINNHIYFNCL